MPGDNSGRKPTRAIEPRYMGSNGFWVEDYGGGCPSRPPFWRTLEESCSGLGSVTFKNKQSTHTVTHAGGVL